MSGQSTYRKREYYQNAFSTNNGSGAVYASVTNKATLSGATNLTNGFFFLPQTPENVFYDPDGNLHVDGRWTLNWDLENRLTNLVSAAGPTLSKYNIDFLYDYLGRRVRKIVSTNNGSSYVVQYTNKFVYDGWNLIAILDGASSVLYSFQWGSDLSGSLAGAGGIGGLISMRVHNGNLAGTFFYIYDGNGNVSGLINAIDGTIAAQYEYGPFGEILRATGPMAKTNPFRFSSKFQDDETDFLYYGFRYYNPSTGRWLSREPLGEFGSKNLYGFVGNATIQSVDVLGLWQEGGHFYTIFAAAIAKGYAPREAYRLAYFAQLPDEIADYSAYDGVMKWSEERMFENHWFHDVQQVLHSLHGQDVKKRRDCLRNLLQDPSLKPIDRGLLLHAFGDAYAHTYVDPKTGKTEAYEYPYGHANTPYKGNAPDLPSLRPDVYKEYVNDVFNSLPAGPLPQDPGLINAILQKNEALSKTSDPFAAQTDLIDFIVEQSGYPNAYRPEEGDYYSNPPTGRDDLGPLDTTRVQRLIDLIKKKCCSK